MEESEEVPFFPMKRASGCPFDPPPKLAEIQAEGSLTRVRTWEGKEPWLITKYEDHKVLLSDPRVSSNPNMPDFPHVSPAQKARRLGAPSLPALDNPRHGEQRRNLNGFFTNARVEQLRPFVQLVVDDLVDSLVAESSPADLFEVFALPFPTRIICHILGVSYEDSWQVHENIDAMMSSRSSAEVATTAIDSVLAYLAGAIAEKAQSPSDDLLSHLGRLVETGVFEEKEARDASLQLILAGHDTTASMIALGALVLLQNPEQLDELKKSDDDKLWADAVEELLRYLTPTQAGRRRVLTEDVEFKGEVMRAGDGIIMAHDIGNRDPEVFEDPNTFDIHRHARIHIAFGFGIHQCLGQQLARQELRIALQTLFRRLPTLELAVPLEDLEFNHDLIAYGVKSLPVKWSV